MKITADTNVLLRIIIPDDEGQQELAFEAMKSAESIVIGTHALCELAWVMKSRYGSARPDIAMAIRSLMNTRNIVMNLPAVEAGLRVLDRGGDFADGVIDFEGKWLGGETFVSFDRKAVKLLQEQGSEAVLLG